MLHRTCNPGFPVQGVRSEALHCTVRIRKLQDTAECALPAVHAFLSERSDDLVSPPARSHLGCQDIGILEKSGDIISVGDPGFLKMGKARFQDFLSDKFAVYVQLADSQRRGHPFRRCHLFRRIHLGNEPARPVCSTLSVPDRAGDYGSVSRRNPFGILPGLTVKGFNKRDAAPVCA